MTHSLERRAWLLPILLPVFLAGCVSQGDYNALQAQNQQLQIQNRQLQQHLAAEQEHVARLQGAVTYAVNSDLLFKQGSYQLSPSGKSIISRMAEKLAHHQQDKVVVNGYTDDTPIGPALQRQGVTSNQVLSQLRADEVMRYMISQGVKPRLVTAHGFGDSQPVASNETAQGRARNRRVEIAVARPTDAQPPATRSEALNSSAPGSSTIGPIWRHIGRMPWRAGQRFGTGPYG